MPRSNSSQQLFPSDDSEAQLSLGLDSAGTDWDSDWQRFLGRDQQQPLQGASGLSSRPVAAFGAPASLDDLDLSSGGDDLLYTTLPLARPYLGSDLAAVRNSLSALLRGALSADVSQPTALPEPAAPASWTDFEEVFVLLFGVGMEEQEGIYSLRAVGGDGLPQETIIAFQNEEDALRYAGLLEATMVHLPLVCPIAPPELLDFCSTAGYTARLEPSGSLLMPPDYNVGVTDWERSLRLREGHWSVLAEEPALGAGATSALQPPVHASAAAAEGGSSKAPQEAAEEMRYGQHFTDDELAAIKARLERLLQQE